MSKDGVNYMFLHILAYIYKKYVMESQTLKGTKPIHYSSKKLIKSEKRVRRREERKEAYRRKRMSWIMCCDSNRWFVIQ